MKKLTMSACTVIVASLMLFGCSSSKPDLTEAYWHYHRNNLREWTQGEKGARLDSLLRELEKPERK